jgi:hypothetical protein
MLPRAKAYASSRQRELRGIVTSNDQERSFAGAGRRSSCGATETRSLFMRRLSIVLALTTKGVVTDARSASNHLLFMNF